MKNTLILLGALVLAQMTTAGELPPQFAGDWRDEWVNPTNTYLQNSNQITASYNSTQFAGTGTTFAGANISARRSRNTGRT